MLSTGFSYLASRESSPYPIFSLAISAPFLLLKQRTPQNFQNWPFPLSSQRSRVYDLWSGQPIFGEFFYCCCMTLRHPEPFPELCHFYQMLESHLGKPGRIQSDRVQVSSLNGKKVPLLAPSRPIPAEGVPA